MSLQKITLRNFQRHRKLTVAFDQSITVLTGRSDVGKSAVLRALRWVCQNSPSGDAFIRHGAKFVRVRLVADGKVIVRKKGKENAYLLGDKKYVAFGAGVPTPIAETLNVSDENFQGQFDPVYWLAQSPGQVSRSLNQIVNLGAIDKSLAHIASEARKAGVAVEVSQNRLKQARSDRDGLNWVPGLLNNLGNLEKHYTRIDLLRTRIASLASLLGQVRHAKQQAQIASGAIQSGLAAVEAGRKVRQVSERVETLRELIAECQNGKDRLCRVRNELAAAKRRFDRATGGACPICGRQLSRSVRPTST